MTAETIGVFWFCLLCFFCGLFAVLCFSFSPVTAAAAAAAAVVIVVVVQSRSLAWHVPVPKRKVDAFRARISHNKHQTPSKKPLASEMMIVPIAVFVFPFVLNVALSLFLDHGPDLTRSIRLATDENVTLVALVVYTVWLVHSVTFAVLLPNPRTQVTQAAALAHNLGRWWTTKWAVLSILHLLCKVAFSFSTSCQAMLLVFDAIVLAVLFSTLGKPSSFPQLTLLSAVGLASSQVRFAGVS